MRQSESPPSVSLRVLVVDDEPLVARSLRRALREHEVVLAGNGEEALSLLTGCDRFDVVLCDLMMPELSGMDVYERVVAERPSLAPRFVFMTGGAFTPATRSFLERVPNEQVEKPFDIGHVRSVVCAVAAKKD